MRAVVLHEYGGHEKLKFENNVPEPQISGGTVLIAAAAASVNPIDWKLRSGMRQEDFPLSFPAILGRDVSGVGRTGGGLKCAALQGRRPRSCTAMPSLVAVDICQTEWSWRTRPRSR
jgi:D-arabinose 1-dehydrogenase-like Zn-dependent alcohol dehydrogenase